ncbi:Tyrosine recombinase XerC [Paraburkholderia aspalathi]|nr:tyrosine-type recombinase/integrase [Paraburkholderia aspalathi]CAE6850662.1 Tyrosine recombinase XerC [Paraburkholderia aspalathi]CAE6861084.1 Tyrosine recombinase XerC [Paraburkholderia aspalathi]
MRLFYTTSDFVYKGRPREGLPFLCYEDMELVKPASDFLLWAALENPRIRSPATWRSYADAIYDYFAWLEANSLSWDALPLRSKDVDEISNLALYRDWSLDVLDSRSGERAMQPATVRKRLSQIMRFYQWAVARNRIASVPWDVVMVSRAEHKSLGSVIRESTLPKVPRHAIRFLTIDQCRVLLQNCGGHTIRLMTKLMLQTGLRNEECRTFPMKYLFDPSPDRRSCRIAIDLSPSDMRLKGSRPRRIYASGQLIKDLFDFANFGEGAVRAKLYRMTEGKASPFVFLNRLGAPWSEKGLCNAYRKLWCPASPAKPSLDFKVTPHMLRHTFATLELYAESQNRNIGYALAWVRDRLGHASISSTTVYVHCLDLLGERHLNQYEREIDALLIGGDER